MNTIQKLIASNTAPPGSSPEDYINPSDGLLYCGKCHTRKQYKGSFKGREFIVSCMCSCETAARDRKDEEHSKNERLMEIQKIRAAGLQDHSLKNCTFENDNGENPLMEKAAAYVKNWEKFHADNIGLLLYGKVGTGKSFFAGCIANALLDQGVPVLMTNFSKILNSLSAMFNEDRNEYIESLNRYSLLILDDLGIQRNTEYAMEQVFNVIDSRYRSGRPMIITTNLSWQELSAAERNDLAHQRIYDRILEVCQPVYFGGKNMRQDNAGKKRAEIVETFRAEYR